MAIRGAGVRALAVTALGTILACARPDPRAAIHGANSVAPPIPNAAPMLQTAEKTGQLTGYISPLFKPPALVHVVAESTFCNPPLLANIAPIRPNWLRWVARTYNGQAMRGYIKRESPTAPYGDWGREPWNWQMDDPVTAANPSGLPSCTKSDWTDNVQNQATDCHWHPTFPWAAQIPLTGQPPYERIDVMEPLADRTRVTDIVTVHDALDFAIFKPAGQCASVHLTGGPFGMSFPLRCGIIPTFKPLSGKSPSTGAVNPGGDLVVLDAGERLVNVGPLGSSDATVVQLLDKTGGPLAPADHLERIGYSSIGMLLGSNKQRLYRINQKSRHVLPIADFGPGPTPAFATAGTANCCDIVHIADPRGTGAWFVAPAGRPEIWVLDDVTLQKKATWAVGKVNGKPAIAVRQLRPILSTGWLYAVVQTAEDPAYNATIVLWKFDLWDGRAEIAPL